MSTDLKITSTNLGYLPEEILFDIFTRLSVKSLCRFRCVSKFWFSIISDLDFIAVHLESSRSRPVLLISVQYLNHQLEKSMCNFFSIDFPHQNSNAQTLRAISHRSTEMNYTSSISPSTSGLICFIDSDIIKIGNPITRDFDVLPHHRLSDRIRTEISLFFGFDPVDKTHVLLKLEDCYTTGSRKSDVFDMVENCWHDNQPHPWFGFDGGESHICINGIIYFTASADEIDECLCSFNVRLKSFQMIERPPDSLSLPDQDKRRFWVELLIEYKGRVAFVGDGDLEDTIEGQVADEVKMWILEDTETHIWNFKSFVVPWRENLMSDGISIDSLESLEFYGERKVNVFGATHRGELILATSLWNISLYLFFYEIETNTLRRFQVDGFGNTPRGRVSISLVIESLETPKGLKKKNKEESCSH